MKIFKITAFVLLLCVNASLLWAQSQRNDIMTLAQGYKGSPKGSYSGGFPRRMKTTEPRRRMKMFPEKKKKKGVKVRKSKTLIPHAPNADKYLKNIDTNYGPNSKEKIKSLTVQGRKERRARKKLIEEKRKKWMDAQKAGDPNWKKLKDEYNALRKK